MKIVLKYLSFRFQTGLLNSILNLAPWPPIPRPSPSRRGPGKRLKHNSINVAFLNECFLNPDNKRPKTEL